MIARLFALAVRSDLLRPAPVVIQICCIHEDEVDDGNRVIPALIDPQSAHLE